MADPRLTPARADLAAVHLRGQVEAATFVVAQPQQVVVPVLDMRDTPSATSLSTQLLYGEAVDVYDTDPATGLAWGQCLTDGYVGYMRLDGLVDRADPPTHRVISFGTQLYADPGLKQTPTGHLPWMAQVAVTDHQAGYAQVAGGWIPDQHLVPLDQAGPDFVTIAESLTGVPYVWGGRSHQGLDCSALVQLAMARAGLSFPRDSDLQRAEGAPISGPLRRGDLAFWPGHVGVMQDAANVLHANIHHMAVASEPLDRAEARIEQAGVGPIIVRKRLLG